METTVEKTEEFEQKWRCDLEDVLKNAKKEQIELSLHYCLYYLKDALRSLNEIQKMVDDLGEGLDDMLKRAEKLLEEVQKQYEEPLEEPQ